MDLWLTFGGENRIILLIWGSFIPSIYYGFAEDMEWVRVYWSMVSLEICFVLGVSLFAFMRLVPKLFVHHHWQPHESMMFVLSEDVVSGLGTRRRADDYDEHRSRP